MSIPTRRLTPVIKLKLVLDFNDDYFKFVAEHRKENPSNLRLKFHGDSRQWIQIAINHIEGLQKCSRKFVADDGTDYTPRVIARPVSVEQATSAAIGDLHNRLAGDAKRVLDMTCGLGVDSRFLSSGRELIAIELDENLAEAARFNFAAFPNIEIVNADSTEWLAGYSGAPFDLVFIDPARRGKGNSRLFKINDCAPDVLSLLPLLRMKTKRVMVKLSPMLDVSQTLRDLPDTVELHIVEERGECRELLALLDFEHSTSEPMIVIHSEGVEFSFTQADEKRANAEIALPHSGMWLCEPGAAAMKSGAFNLLAHRLNLSPISKNTHLFLSDTKPLYFPGKSRLIEDVYPLTSSTLKSIGKKLGSADVAVRNLPQFTPEQLAKRMGIKSGGDFRVIGCSVADGTKALIVVRKNSV